MIIIAIAALFALILVYIGIIFLAQAVLGYNNYLYAAIIIASLIVIPYAALKILFYAARSKTISSKNVEPELHLSELPKEGTKIKRTK
jgi:hypothetical protein